MSLTSIKYGTDGGTEGAGNPWYGGLGLAQDNSGPYTTRDSNLNSTVLYNNTYGFSIPTSGTINGIEVTIRRYHTVSTSPMPIDVTVQLRKAGSPVGSNLSAGAALIASWEDKVFGGATNLWGTTWTPAEVNAAGFGVGYQLYRYTTTSGDPYVDSLKITIYYTNPGGVLFFQQI